MTHNTTSFFYNKNEFPFEHAQYKLHKIPSLRLSSSSDGDVMKLGWEMSTLSWKTLQTSNVEWRPTTKSREMCLIGLLQVNKLIVVDDDDDDDDCARPNHPSLSLSFIRLSPLNHR